MYLFQRACILENSQVGVTGNIITKYFTLNIFMKAYVLSNSIIKFSLTKNQFYKVVSTYSYVSQNTHKKRLKK
jgi:hypothetical protein